MQSAPDSTRNISIHSLRMEGDFIVSQRSDVRTGFQSTPSAWRETTTNAAMSGIVVDISIHSLRMEGDI